MLRACRSIVRVSKGTSKPGVDGANPTPLLRAAHPNVTDLRIELEFIPEPGWYPSMQVHILHPPARAAFRYPCPFAGCSGWFELESPVTQLLRNNSAKSSGEISCTGTRPRDRGTGNVCDATLKYRLRAAYTSESR
jgi:hypothetical protein